MKLFKIAINASWIFLILTGLLHSLSFIVKQEPSNDTEKQMLDLIQNYQMDLGNGFLRSFHDIYLSMSISFTMLCIFGGILLYYLNKNRISKIAMTGVLNIYLIFYGVLYLAMWKFTFLPPIVCVTFIFLSLVVSRMSIKHVEY
jgi:hypothetical protein